MKKEIKFDDMQKKIINKIDNLNKIGITSPEQVGKFVEEMIRDNIRKIFKQLNKKAKVGKGAICFGDNYWKSADIIIYYGKPVNDDEKIYITVDCKNVIATVEVMKNVDLSDLEITTEGTTPKFKRILKNVNKIATRKIPYFIIGVAHSHKKEELLTICKLLTNKKYGKKIIIDDMFLFSSRRKDRLFHSGELKRFIGTIEKLCR